jgi:hypothetical protein
MAMYSQGRFSGAEWRVPQGPHAQPNGERSHVTGYPTDYHRSGRPSSVSPWEGPLQNAAAADSSTRPDSISNYEKTDHAQTQRLPSLRSILNAPSSTPTPSQTSPVANGEGRTAPVPRPASPHFFREGLPSPVGMTFRPGQYRTEVPPTTAPPRLHMPTTPTTSYEVQGRPPYRPQQQADHVPSPDGSSPRTVFEQQYHKAASVASSLTLQSERAVSITSCNGNEEDIAKLSLKRSAEPSQRAQKLARCLGQKQIPGEGLCYVYEDGSYCRTVIDGERVNPAWGITKAGKPRKRLAQACLTCREKKIKCEPAYPKCHQCHKSQRLCRG